ncbi:MAG: NAD(P)/FAD-dependent oxidoreductase [Ilumatobacteraceae bacterium]
MIDGGGRSAHVVGSGPNGLVAAVTLARAGWHVVVHEAASTPGGGTRSSELTVPGAVHDVCSAVHPLAVASPAFREFAGSDHPLDPDILHWVHPEVPLAHPLDGGRAALLHRSIDDTAQGLGIDADAYRSTFGRHVEHGLDLTDSLLSPMTLPPRHPAALARFGLTGVQSAHRVASRRFEGDAARALFGGLAAHSILPLTAPATAAYGMVLGALAHVVGWPVARGGSQRIADALVADLQRLGGEVICDRRIDALADLPAADATLLDLTPRQVVAIAGDVLPDRYRRALSSYRYGPGVFKVDWALDGPIPWANPECARAGTVHLGGTLEEITAAEAEVAAGRLPQRPYVLLVQPTRFDDARAPAGTETVWAYCHVPSGSTVDMTQRIESQIERFAPGFRDRIIGCSTMDTSAMQAHNANYVDGDINGGAGDLRQFVRRPTLGLHPWRTPVAGLYLCSSSTPPGGGVHGMCGWHAAHEVLRSTPA